MIIKTFKDIAKLDKLIQAGKRPKQIIAFKYVSARRPPYFFGSWIKYIKGSTVSIKRFSRDTYLDCAVGLNVACLQWVFGEFGVTSLSHLKNKWKRNFSVKNFSERNFELIKVLVTGDVVIPYLGHQEGIRKSYYGKFRTNELKVLT